MQAQYFNIHNLCTVFNFKKHHNKNNNFFLCEEQFFRLFSVEVFVFFSDSSTKNYRIENPKNFMKDLKI